MSIIGISGKIGSGKDTIGKIIQYLTTPENNAKDLATYFSNQWSNEKYEWQIVKFADALKDIVCILTGCTREQLEDSDFKNSRLSSEWNTVHPNIWDHNIQTIAPTYRELLQKLGTDLLRNQLHENVWVNALFSKYKTTNLVTKYTKDNNPIIGNIDHEYKQYDYPNWIITDCRFENEAKAIKDRGGILIRINRNQVCKCGMYLHEHTQLENHSFVEVIENNHPSETALDDYNFDYIIDNNSTIEDLIVKVKEILIKEKII